MRYYIFLTAILLVGCKSQTILVSTYDIEIEEHRETYKSNFLNEGHSPLVKEDLKNLNFFAADKSYRCNCKVELLTDQKPFEVDTYSGQKKTYIRYATAMCGLPDGEQKLTLYKIMRLQSMPGYKDYLFLPFMDLTNGESTYGGGRYIDLKTSDINDQGFVTIDFNKCYNPYCAFSDGYNCPVPPVENHMDIAIPAGEKMYTGTKKQRPH